MIRTCVIFVTVFAAAAAAAQTPEPVADPTGTLTGKIDGAAFDLPIICETEGPWLIAKSHEIAYNSDPAAIDAAVTVAMPSGRLAVTAMVNGRLYEFVGKGAETGRQVEYSGTMQSNDGDFDVTLRLDCDG
jgi:hypothetical protein